MGIKYETTPGYLESDVSVKKEKLEVEEIAKEILDIPANPKLKKGKRLVSIRYDQKILDYFEATGMGWQTRMNAVLLDYVERKIRG